MKKKPDTQNDEEEDFFSDDEIDSTEEGEDQVELSDEQIAELTKLLEAEYEDFKESYTAYIKECTGKGKTLAECAKAWKKTKAEMEAEGEDKYPYPKGPATYKCPEGEEWDPKQKKCVPKKKPETEKATLTASFDAFESIEITDKGVKLTPKAQISTKGFAELDEAKEYSLDLLVEGSQEDVENKKLKDRLDNLEKSKAELEKKVAELEKPAKKGNFSKTGEKASFEEALVARFREG